MPDTSVLRDAVDDLKSEFRFISPWRFTGPILQLTFTAANVPQEVQHGCGVVPDGYDIFDATGPVFRAPGKIATPTLFYMQTSGTAPVNVKLRFGLFRDDPRNPQIQG